MKIWPLLATHALVAMTAWLNGWLGGVWAERRRREDAIIDLTGRCPYDWRVDGECIRQVIR